MIKELSELGKKIRIENVNRKLVHNALKEEPVSIDLVIKKDGTFVNLYHLRKK